MVLKLPAITLFLLGKALFTVKTRAAFCSRLLCEENSNTEFKTYHLYIDHPLDDNHDQLRLHDCQSPSKQLQ